MPAGTPVLAGTTAITNFIPNPSWTAVSFTASAAIIYNTSSRLGSPGRAVSVHNFGGPQTISSGTFTVLMPVADQTVLRIG
jgi:hypothetical protein